MPPKLRIALRALLGTPVITSVAVLSLALGIGGTVAIFSVFHELILRSLPVAEPRGLVNFVAPGPKSGSNSCNNQGTCDEIFSFPMFRDLEAAQDVFTGIAAHRSFYANLAYDGVTLVGTGMLVSGDYFGLLDARPHIGRLILPDDDAIAGEAAVAVLSHSYWRNRFDGDPGVLDRELIVNGQGLTIVGVAPEGFHGTSAGVRPQLYVPITLRGRMEPGFNGFENRRNHWAYLFARLRDGVSTERAETAVNVAYNRILNDVEAPLQNMSPQTLDAFRSRRIVLEDGRRGQSRLDEEARTPILVLMAVTAVVLLIACANVANLLLARSSGRTGEMSVRLSVGASRGQLIAQLLTESCLLAVLGGLAGLLVAGWTLDWLIAMVPARQAMQLDLGLNLQALWFAAALTIATGILFGLFPATQATRPDLLSTLKSQGGNTTGTPAASRFRAALVIGQIALSMALLVGAGLFIGSLYNISRVDLGLDATGLASFSINPQFNGYSNEQARALYQRVEDELAAIPGVRSASASTIQILAGSNMSSNVSVEGFEHGPDIDDTSPYNVVGPGYFRTLGIPLVAGRDFTEADAGDESPAVAIVNEAFARKFDLGLDAVGRRMARGRNGNLDMEIVGLARDAKYSGVRNAVPPQFFTPYRQSNRSGGMNFYVRTSLDPSEVLQMIRPAIARLDPNLPVNELTTMAGQIEDNVAQDRLVGTLSTSFAVLATLLAAVGLYGVLSYTVNQRRREIGLRMAFGAERRHVRAMVLRQLGWLTAAGALIGLAMGLAIGRFAESLLFELAGYDPVVLTVATVVLVLVASAAGALPAYRASQVDPTEALRSS